MTRICLFLCNLPIMMCCACVVVVVMFNLRLSQVRCGNVQRSRRHFVPDMFPDMIVEQKTVKEVFLFFIMSFSPHMFPLSCLHSSQFAQFHLLHQMERGPRSIHTSPHAPATTVRNTATASWNHISITSSHTRPEELIPSDPDVEGPVLWGFNSVFEILNLLQPHETLKNAVMLSETNTHPAAVSTGNTRLDYTFMSIWIIQ